MFASNQPRSCCSTRRIFQTTHAPIRSARSKCFLFYPPNIREWVIHARALESIDFDDAKKLTGEQLILMGVTPCSIPDAAPSENAR